MLVFVAAMWLIELVDLVATGLQLDVHGIKPRTIGGLDGILWAPFLHRGFGHLAANTLPLVVLGGFVLVRGRRQWLTITALIVLLAGLATWAFARSAIHIGASVLVFGYAGFLVAIGIVERSVVGALTGILVVVLFGGTLAIGVLPVQRGISWEGHIFGLLAGVVVAFAIGERRKRNETVES